MLRLVLRRKRFVVFLLFFALMISCKSPQISGETTVSITADGETRQATIPRGQTVSQALQSAGYQIGSLDKTEPPLYAVLNDGDSIVIVRVQETFETKEVVVPFERQVVRNETLPEGETRLAQAGINGLQEITYRKILEDGIETSQSAVKTVILKEAQAEIVMVGAQASFAPLNISGTLAYLAGGNAWIMEDSTANRRVVVSTGDLDGRIFTLSPNGEYLVFTRKSAKPADQEINTLWVVRVKNTKPALISLQAKNVVHFAEWIPGTNSVMYSTVEPRAAAPGWQANNDLYRVGITNPNNPARILFPNSGGVYGWWGMSFAFAPDGRLAYVRPDGVGLVDQDSKRLKPMLDITPFNTHSDWAWIPPLVWGADGNSLYFVSHAPAPAPISEEESPYFDLSAVSLENSAAATLVRLAGMFAYPSVSPIQRNGKEAAFQVAYLQAIFSDQSESSRYRLMIMDRDGSNSRALFPPADKNGLEPQTPAWSPAVPKEAYSGFIAVVYQGNLWLADSVSGGAYQVTGDGMISRIAWK
ncbi:MAG: G5 domain-containing protein [Anaerolineales bacterium]|nr:G5 domain-containing protein [Anaerolineales bacterium]